MAMAETGEYERAASLQRATLVLADRANATDARPFILANLALYEQRKPAREPWPANHPIFNPRHVQAAARPAPSAPSASR